MLRRKRRNSISCAQSGDLTGAIRIYGKALELADSDSEKMRIQDILAELKSRQ